MVQTKYFNSIDILDKDALRAEYKRLALKLHPDQGGNETDFKQLKDEYDSLLKTKQNIVINDPVADATIILGFDRKKRKQRPTEPKDIERKMNVSLQELYTGFKNDIIYSRNVHKHDRLIQQEVSLNVTIASHFLNKNSEIIYQGYGDKGLHGDDGDLILITHFEDDSISIDFSTDLPTVVEERILRTWDNEIEITFPNGETKTYDISYETSTILVSKKGLKFKTKSNKLVHGDYRVEIKRF